ncbi:hypothetical protein [Rhodococcoides fascians]|uniref:hypothetical protein n=1 Tax=Rhodococcoides fascians TaxID=1828 RepID=UPI001427DABE
MITDQDREYRRAALKMYGRMFRSASGLKKLANNPQPGQQVLVALETDTAASVFERLHRRHNGVGRVVIYTPGKDSLQILDVVGHQHKGEDPDGEADATVVGAATTIGMVIASQHEFEKLNSGSYTLTAQDLELA